MSSRLQEINNLYNRKKIEAENNEKILKDVLSSLNAIKSSLSQETIDVVNVYHPGLLDMLNFDNLSKDGKFNDINENIETLKNNLKYVIDSLLSSMEKDLV